MGASTPRQRDRLFVRYRQDRASPWPTAATRCCPAELSRTHFALPPLCACCRYRRHGAPRKCRCAEEAVAVSPAPLNGMSLCLDLHCAKDALGCEPGRGRRRPSLRRSIAFVRVLAFSTPPVESLLPSVRRKIGVHAEHVRRAGELDHGNVIVRRSLHLHRVRRTPSPEPGRSAASAPTVLGDECTICATPDGSPAPGTLTTTIDP